MTKEIFIYGLNACAVTYHNGQKLYEHDELVKCFEDLEIFEQEPCEDAISRQAVDTLVDELARAISDERCCISRGRSTATIMQDILDLPPVKLQPKTGHWIEENGFDGDTYYDCSECGESFCLIDGTPTDNLYNYCPNCGAKMQEVEDDAN